MWPFLSEMISSLDHNLWNILKKIIKIHENIRIQVAYHHFICLGNTPSQNPGLPNTRFGMNPRPSRLSPLSNLPSFQQSRQEDSSIETTSTPSVSGSTTSTPQTSDSMTFTTNTFTSSRTGASQYNSYAPRRRRLFPCRISAFMPTRVNYCFRPPPRLRRSSHMFRGRFGCE